MKLWYYEAGGTQKGPVDFNTFQMLIQEEVITRSTLVWLEGMTKWMLAGNVQGLFAKPPPLDSSVNRLRSFKQRSNKLDENIPYIRDHMTWSIIVTLCFFIPLGILAVIAASKARRAFGTGNYEEAQRLANISKEWADWGFAIGLIVGLIAIFVIVFGR